MKKGRGMIVNHVCSFCGAPASQKCAGCKSEWYCSRKHQKSMWKAHKKACRAAKAEAEAMREVMAKVSGGSTDVEGCVWEFVVRPLPQGLQQHGAVQSAAPSASPAVVADVNFSWQCAGIVSLWRLQSRIHGREQL